MAVSGLFSAGVWMKPALAIWGNKYPEDNSPTGQQANVRADLQFCSLYIQFEFKNETLNSYCSSVSPDSQIPLVFKQWVKTNSYFWSSLCKHLETAVTVRHSHMRNCCPFCSAPHWWFICIFTQKSNVTVANKHYTGLRENACGPVVMIHWPHCSDTKAEGCLGDHKNQITGSNQIIATLRSHQFTCTSQK